MTLLALTLSRVRAAAGRIWGTARLEVRLNLAGPAPWVIGLVLSAFGYLVVRTAPDDTSFAISWVLAKDLGPLAEILLLFLAASLAHRPQRYEVSELQDSKLVASEELILGRWVGMVVAVLTPLVVQYLVTMVGQRIHAKAPVVPLAYLFSFVHLLPSVLFLTTCAFCFVVLTRVLILGAGLGGLVWFVLYFGQSYYPSAFRVELSQNRFVFYGLTATVLTWMLLGYRARRRAKRSGLTYGLAITMVFLAASTLLHAGWVALAVPGKQSAVATWQRLQAAQRRKGDPLPNFAWTDAFGRRVSLAKLRGRPALLVFFQPKDHDVVPLLGRLARLRGELAAGKLGILAICLSQDLDGATDAARLAGPQVLDRLPLVTDWGHAGGREFQPADPGSVVAWALRIGPTPTAMLVNADGKVMASNLAVDQESWSDLKARIQTVLTGQPEEPGPPESPLPGLLS